MSQEPLKDPLRDEDGYYYVTYLHHEEPLSRRTIQQIIFRTKELMLKYKFHYDEDIQRRINAINLVPLSQVEIWNKILDYNEKNKVIKQWVMEQHRFDLTESDFGLYNELVQRTKRRDSFNYVPPEPEPDAPKGLKEFQEHEKLNHSPNCKVCSNPGPHAAFTCKDCNFFQTAS